LPVYLTVRLDFREVVDKGGVNHGVRQGCSAAQAFQVFQIAPVHLGSGGDKGPGARIGAGETKHPVARINEIRNNGGTDESCGASDEDTHYDFSFTSIHDRNRGIRRRFLQMPYFAMPATPCLARLPSIPYHWKRYDGGAKERTCGRGDHQQGGYARNALFCAYASAGANADRFPVDWRDHRRFSGRLPLHSPARRFLISRMSRDIAIDQLECASL